MHRTLSAALLPFCVAPLLLIVADPAGADSGAGCAMPVAERNYTDSQLTYRLAVDLADCEWWDGSPIQLDASLDRLDPTEGRGTTTLMICGTALAGAPSSTEGTTGGVDSTDESTASPEDAKATRRPMSTSCAVEVVLEHPGAEMAHYQGAVSFPWERGRRSISFTALCGSGSGCVDLPVDPTRDLADVYDKVGGGDD